MTDLMEIRMKMIGGRQVYEEGKLGSKGIREVSTSSTAAGTAAGKASKKTSLLTRAYRGLGRVAKFAFAAIAVSGVFALKSAIDKTVELSKTTTGLNRNLGFTVQEASRWGAVAEARDIDSKALSTTFTILSSKMVEAGRKGGTALTAFHQLGLTQADATKGAKHFQWGLLQVAKALGDEAGGAKRMTAAKALLGKGFQTVLPLFSEGVKGLKEQLRWADKYGVTLSGKTNDAVMEFVTAQRESKVAMLGLKVSLATALMPALKDGQDQLQKFIATLNDPHLSADQKVDRIGTQFEALEDKLIGVITDALPKVAEGAGVLGVKMAGAIFKGFMHSNVWGKLVISAWLLKFMGGGGLIRTVAGKGGKAIALGILRVLVPTLAAELAAGSTLGQVLSKRFQGLGRLSGLAFTAGLVLGMVAIGFVIAQLIDEKTHGAFRRWGVNAGQNFVNALIFVVNKGIQLVNKTLDEANVLSILGVDAPQIGEIGGVNFEPPPPSKSPFGIPRADPNHPGNPFHIGGKGKGGGKRSQPPAASKRNTLMAGPRVTHEHIHVEVDGKEIAEVVLRKAQGAAAIA